MSTNDATTNDAAAWRALVAGLLVVVELNDRDGRRTIVARPRAVDGCSWDALTPCERDAVALAAAGHTNKLIAYELGIATSTVAMRLLRATRKLGLRSRVELIASFHRGAP